MIKSITNFSKKLTSGPKSQLLMAMLSLLQSKMLKFCFGDFFVCVCVSKVVGLLWPDLGVQLWSVKVLFEIWDLDLVFEFCFSEFAEVLKEETDQV